MIRTRLIYRTTLRILRGQLVKKEPAKRQVLRHEGGTVITSPEVELVR